MLGYSRRVYAAAFRHERQSAWLEGIEGAFRHFGRLPGELLLDNARALVKHHDAATRVEPRGSPDASNPEIRRTRWSSTTGGTRSPATGTCGRSPAPYRARTKGKDERGVGCVKHNAIAGRRFASWGALEAHLAWWMREVADQRVHGTTGEAPIARFERERLRPWRPLNARPPFHQPRELTRRVQVEPRGSPENDACVDIDTKHYSVPWTLIGAQVSVVVGDGQVRIHHAGLEVACHDKRLGRRERVVDRAHLHGIVPCRPDPASTTDLKAAMPMMPPGPPSLGKTIR